jgi:UDP-N-acetylmuramate dehydrogenase
VEPEVSLAPLTWYGVGGPAEVLARPLTPEEAAELVRRACAEGAPVRVLGAGSNLLVADRGVRGLVLVLSSPPFTHLARVADDVVHAGAGCRLRRLVESAADWGLGGLEGLAGVPGTVGGALVSNAGTSEGEIGPAVSKVWALEPDGGRAELSATDCRFGYRSSALRGTAILGAELALRRAGPAEIFARMDSLAARRKASQPEGRRTAGCVFRNPAGVPAGRLLDELGLKGFAAGGARVSEVHANFIETAEGATAADVVAVIRECRRRAMDARGVALELEIATWGFEPGEI